LAKSVQAISKQETILAQANANVQTVGQISDLSAEIVDALIEKIILYPNKRIAIKFRFLDDFVFNFDETSLDMETTTANVTKGGTFA